MQGCRGMQGVAERSRWCSGKGREQEATEIRLKILEDGRDKLMNLADAMHAEAEDKMGEELIQLNGKILYKKDNVQNMAQMLMNSDDLNM